MVPISALCRVHWSVRTIVAAARGPSRVRIHWDTMTRVGTFVTQAAEGNVMPGNAKLLPFRLAATVGRRRGCDTNSTVKIVKAVENR